MFSMYLIIFSDCKSSLQRLTKIQIVVFTGGLGNSNLMLLSSNLNQINKELVWLKHHKSLTKHQFWVMAPLVTRTTKQCPTIARYEKLRLTLKYQHLFCTQLDCCSLVAFWRSRRQIDWYTSLHYKYFVPGNLLIHINLILNWNWHHLWYFRLLTAIQSFCGSQHSVKIVWIRSFFWSYFALSGLNTEIDSVNLLAFCNY